MNRVKRAIVNLKEKIELMSSFDVSKLDCADQDYFYDALSYAKKSKNIIEELNDRVEIMSDMNIGHWSFIAQNEHYSKLDEYQRELFLLVTELERERL